MEKEGELEWGRAKSGIERGGEKRDGKGGGLRAKIGGLRAKIYM